jgi:hypothetical protein
MVPPPEQDPCHANSARSRGISSPSGKLFPPPDTPPERSFRALHDDHDLDLGIDDGFDFDFDFDPNVDIDIDFDRGGTANALEQPPQTRTSSRSDVGANTETG